MSDRNSAALQTSTRMEHLAKTWHSYWIGTTPRFQFPARKTRKDANLLGSLISYKTCWTDRRHTTQSKLNLPAIVFVNRRGRSFRRVRVQEQVVVCNLRATRGVSCRYCIRSWLSGSCPMNMTVHYQALIANNRHYYPNRGWSRSYKLTRVT